MKTVCLLLAAGSSSRMGQPKMLLDFNGKTLLQHIIDEVKQLKDASLLVVTGCYHNLLKEILQAQQIPFIQNEQWQEGMGTSIHKGIVYLQEHYSNADNVMVLVCDQPYISSVLLQEMIDAKQTTGKGIAACTYNGITGTPVLFDKKYFNQLTMLHGAHGAKKMIQQFTDDITLINFPAGAIDIDTPDDYNKLKGLL
jgi:molybdenum cofactor cytidylyltransferase